MKKQIFKINTKKFQKDPQNRTTLTKLINIPQQPSPKRPPKIPPKDPSKYNKNTLNKYPKKRPPKGTSKRASKDTKN